MKRWRTRVLYGILAALVLAATAAVPVQAEETEAPAVQPETMNEATAGGELVPVTTDQAQAAMAAAGLRVVLDPETGQLRAPTEAEAASLFPRESVEKQRAPDEQNLVLEQGPDGALVLHLDERFHQAAVVTLDAEGRPVIQHHVDAATFEAQALEAVRAQEASKETAGSEVPQ